MLERVRRFAGREVQRLGLSATIGNPEALLEWLAPASSRPRRIIAPNGRAVQSASVQLDYVGGVENTARVVSSLHKGEKRLVFCDSRARVEELAAGLRQLCTETFVSHSSLSLDERRRSEDAFAQGNDCVIVATSTLELGIDVGDLDRVIQVDAPATVASFSQPKYPGRYWCGDCRGYFTARTGTVRSQSVRRYGRPASGCSAAYLLMTARKGIERHADE